MEVINATHQTITFTFGDMQVSIKLSGILPYVMVQTVQIGNVEIDGMEVAIYQTTFGAVEGLPPYEPDKCYIVHPHILSAIGKERTDLFAPVSSQIVIGLMRG